MRTGKDGVLIALLLGCTIPSFAQTTPAAFTPDMSFEDAITILKNATNPPLKVLVLWKDLAEQAGIYPETEIGIDGLSGVPLRTHLEVLLLGVSANSPIKLGYQVRHGTIVISTQGRFKRRYRTRVYDITDIIAPPANYWYHPVGVRSLFPMY